MRILIFLFLIQAIQLNGQNKSEYKIDYHADTIKEDNFSKIKILTQKLVKPAKSDTEKVRAIFYWVAKNIKYDFQGLNTKQWDTYGIDNEVAAATFVWKKGICRGFASLMKIMLNEARIENELVFGNGKGEALKGDTTRSNHVWNSVKLNGKWQLLDVTWANVGWSNRKIDDTYFLTEPIQFHLTHYPDSSKWLLHDNPITYEEYNKLPSIGGNYFALGFGTAIPKIDKMKDKIVFRLQIPKDYEMEILLRNKKTEEETLFHNLETKKEGNISIISLPINQKGKFVIEINAMDKYSPYRKYFSIITTNFEN